MSVQSSFLIMAPNLKQTVFPVTGEWINKLGYINTTEYYSAGKINELLIHVTTWMNFTIVLKEARHKRVFDV